MEVCMLFVTEKITISRKELMASDDFNMEKIIIDEEKNQPVENLLCEMVSRIINENKEVA